MVATKSLLESHDWFGSFQHPHASSQLTGKLTYVPERGLRLEWFVPFDTYDARGEILHGTLEQGLPCTLYGNFGTSNAGLAYNMGTMVNKGQWSPRACVLGFQFDKEDTFDGIDFEVNNLQEFLLPEGAHEITAWAKGPVLDVTHHDLKIQIIQAGNFGFFGPAQARALVMSQDDALNADLEGALREVFARHPEKIALYRKELRLKFRVLFNEETTPNRAWSIVNRLRLLFAVLMFRSVSPTEVTLLCRETQSAKLHSFPLLAWVGGVNSQTSPRLQRKVNYQNLPCNFGSIDLAEAICRWFTCFEDFELFAMKLANDDGLRDSYKTQTEFVLQLTQLEAINDTLGLPYQSRYSNALRSCGGAALASDLFDLLDVQTDQELGERLSDLRGEIAHFGRPRKLLPKYLDVLFDVCRLIDVAIAAHIIERLGAPAEVVAAFVEALKE